MSDREDILAALFAALQAIPGPAFQRNGVLPTRIPAGGLCILRDGDPGDPEVTLSPLTYIYEHEAALEVLVQVEATQDALLDSISEAVGLILEADRTLSGRLDWLEGKAPEAVDLPVEGGEPIKAAVIGIMLHYGTQHPL